MLLKLKPIQAICIYPSSNYVLILIIIISMISIYACGYRLVGTDTSLPKEIKSLFIPVFLNTSGEPEIEKIITNKLKDEFIFDGRLKIVDENDSDVKLLGEVKRYQLIPLSIDTQDNIKEYWVELDINVKIIRNNANDEVVLEQLVNTKWDYKVTSSIVEAEAKRLKAVDEASRLFAQRVISIFIEGF